MTAELTSLAERGLLRAPMALDSAVGATVRVAGRDLTCLCSNDYLGLANDPAVRAAAAGALEKWGVGAGASRLVSGTMGPHLQLERELAAFKKTEAAMVTSTGWIANRAAICALAGAGDLILCDKLNHASILDAAQGSRAKLRTYPHRDTARLKILLDRERSQHRRCLLVTDSLFSMDGDLAPLRELVDLKTHYDATLLIDEAHATGVLGPGGRGLAEHLHLEDEIDVTVGTLSKALGAMGGFIAGPAPLIDLLRTSARAYIYTTAPPPAICAAASESLRIVRYEPARRETLLAMATELRAALHERGLDTMDSASPIIPVLVGAPSRAVRIAQQLFEAGFLLPAIRPPTVAPGTSRLRISLSAAHSGDMISQLPDLLAELLASPASAKDNTPT